MGMPTRSGMSARIWISTSDSDSDVSKLVGGLLTHFTKEAHWLFEIFWTFRCKNKPRVANFINIGDKISPEFSRKIGL